MSILAINNSSYTFAQAITANIRAITAWRGVSQTQVAELLGTTQAAMSHKWNGKRPWKLDEIEHIAQYLGIEPWELTKPLYQTNTTPRTLQTPEPSDSKHNPYSDGLHRLISINECVTDVVSIPDYGYLLAS